MAFYDAERIIDEADALSVAEFLNMDIQRRNNRHLIKCPGHEKRMGKVDENFGSCFLTPKGYHCFACGVTVQLVDMVMEYEECNYQEALGLIGDSLGGRNLFVVEGNPEEVEVKEKLFSSEDLELIGIKSSISFDCVYNMASSKEEILAYNKTNEDEDEKKVKLIPKIPVKAENDTDYLAVTHQTVSFKSIYREDPETYFYIVKNKAKEAMEKYRNCIDTICNRGSEESYMLLPLCKGEELDEEVLYDMKQIYTSFYNRAKEIYLQITPEMTGETGEVTEEPKKKPKMRLDLFD